MSSQRNKTVENFQEYRDLAPEIIEDSKIHDIIKLYDNDRDKILVAITNLWEDTPDRIASGSDWVTHNSKTSKKTGTKESDKLPTAKDSEFDVSGWTQENGASKGRGKSAPPSNRAGRGDRQATEKSTSRGRGAGRGNAPGRSYKSSKASSSTSDFSPSSVPTITPQPSATTESWESSNSSWGDTSSSAFIAQQNEILLSQANTVTASSSSGVIAWKSGGLNLAEKLKLQDAEKMRRKVEIDLAQEMIASNNSASDFIDSLDSVSNNAIHYLTTADVINESDNDLAAAVADLTLLSDHQFRNDDMEDTITNDLLASTASVSASALLEPDSSSGVNVTSNVGSVSVSASVGSVKSQESSITDSYLKLGRWGDSSQQNTPFQFGSFGSNDVVTSDDVSSVSVGGWGTSSSIDTSVGVRVENTSASTQNSSWSTSENSNNTTNNSNDLFSQNSGSIASTSTAGNKQSVNEASKSNSKPPPGLVSNDSKAPPGLSTSNNTRSINAAPISGNVVSSTTNNATNNRVNKSNNDIQSTAPLQQSYNSQPSMPTATGYMSNQYSTTPPGINLRGSNTTSNVSQVLPQQGVAPQYYAGPSYDHQLPYNSYPGTAYGTISPVVPSIGVQSNSALPVSSGLGTGQANGLSQQSTSIVTGNGNISSQTTMSSQSTSQSVNQPSQQTTQPQGITQQSNQSTQQSPQANAALLQQQSYAPQPYPQYYGTPYYANQPYYYQNPQAIPGYYNQGRSLYQPGPRGGVYGTDPYTGQPVYGGDIYGQQVAGQAYPDISNVTNAGYGAGIPVVNNPVSGGGNQVSNGASVVSGNLSKASKAQTNAMSHGSVNSNINSTQGLGGMPDHNNYGYGNPYSQRTDLQASNSWNYQPQPQGMGWMGYPTSSPAGQAYGLPQGVGMQQQSQQSQLNPQQTASQGSGVSNNNSTGSGQRSSGSYGQSTFNRSAAGTANTSYLN